MITEEILSAVKMLAEMSGEGESFYDMLCDFDEGDWDDMTNIERVKWIGGFIA